VFHLKFAQLFVSENACPTLRQHHGHAARRQCQLDLTARIFFEEGSAIFLVGVWEAISYLVQLILATASLVHSTKQRDYVLLRILDHEHTAAIIHRRSFLVRTAVNYNGESSTGFGTFKATRRASSALVAAAMERR